MRRLRGGAPRSRGGVAQHGGRSAHERGPGAARQRNGRVPAHQPHQVLQPEAHHLARNNVNMRHAVAASTSLYPGRNASQKMQVWRGLACIEVKDTDVK